MATLRLDDSAPHACWDNSLEPRLEIRSGDKVVFETLEASAGQITPKSSHAALTTMSFDPIHPLTGPVFVKGAEPGDTLEVEVVRLKHKGWGWNGVLRASACWRMIFASRICTITHSPGASAYFARTSSSLSSPLRRDGRRAAGAGSSEHHSAPRERRQHRHPPLNGRREAPAAGTCK